MKACWKPLSGLELSHPTFAVVALAGNARLMCLESEGTFIHRDHWLEDDEKSSGVKIMPCVSRFEGKTLVLDR